MNVYKIMVDDFSDSDKVVREEQYAIADSFHDVYEAVKSEGVGYDKELVGIIEATSSVRIIPPANKEPSDEPTNRES